MRNSEVYHQPWYTLSHRQTPPLPGGYMPWSSAFSPCVVPLGGMIHKCAMRLTGELGTCRGPGASCELVHLCWEDHREQWEDSCVANRSSWASPNQLQITWPLLGRVSTLLGVWLVMRVHRPHDWREQTLPWWLMYCMSPLQCCPSSPTCACPEPDVKTASGLITQATILGSCKQSPV